MWTQLFKCFTQFFAAATVLGEAAEHSANAVNYLAKTGEEKANAFYDDARAERQKQLAKFTAELKTIDNKVGKAA